MLKLRALLHAEDWHSLGDVLYEGTKKCKYQKRKQEDHEPLHQVSLTDEVGTFMLGLTGPLFGLEKFAEVPNLVETDGAEVVRHPEHGPADPGF
jgi:hypothetical protein